MTLSVLSLNPPYLNPQARWQGDEAGAGPRVAERLVAWLKGDERPGGCPGACRCRPTARRALHAVSVIRWCVYAADLCGDAFGFVRDLLAPRFGFGFLS